MTQVLMLLKTTGLDYDDRVRKEALSLRRLGHDVSIVALEYANEAGARMVHGDVQAFTLRLRSRDWLPRKSGLMIKSLEMYVQLLGWVLRRKPHVVWAHNLEMLGLMPVLIVLRRLGYVKRLVWDQHELPSDAMLANRVYMWVYKTLSNGCDVVVMANGERRELLQSLVKLQTQVEILLNYPDRVFQKLPRMDLPPSVSSWLTGTPYLLAQGGGSPERHLWELVEAVLGYAEIKLIVVGPYQEQYLSELSKLYGELWRERILFTGFVPQLEIVPYIDHAVASVVFYSVSTNNSRLCAPNRLYQALVRGVPVVVSPNPPLRRLVEDNECGVVVDPRDAISIREAIQNIVHCRQTLSDQSIRCARMFVWDEQDSTIARIISNL